MFTLQCQEFTESRLGGGGVCLDSRGAEFKCFHIKRIPLDTAHNFTSTSNSRSDKEFVDQHEYCAIVKKTAVSLCTSALEAGLG